MIIILVVVVVMIIIIIISFSFSFFYALKLTGLLIGLLGHKTLALTRRS